MIFFQLVYNGPQVKFGGDRRVSVSPVNKVKSSKKPANRQTPALNLNSC